MHSLENIAHHFAVLLQGNQLGGVDVPLSVGLAGKKLTFYGKLGENLLSVHFECSLTVTNIFEKRYAKPVVWKICIKFFSKNYFQYMIVP